MKPRKRPSQPRPPARRRAGRPTAAQTEAIERSILSGARRLFLTRGYIHTSMEGIAAEAGISKGTLYARYRTKDAVLLALTERDTVYWSPEDVRAHAPPVTNLRERLAYRARRLVEYITSEKMQSAARLVDQGGKAVEAVRAMYYRTMHQHAIHEIAQDIVDGSRDAPQPVPAEDARTIAVMLMALIDGWARSNTFLGPLSREAGIAFADRAIEILFLGRAGWAASARA